MLFAIFIGLFLISCVVGEEIPSKVVKTSSGLVKGYKSNEGEFYAFYGIPYATALSGKYRFMEPLAPPVWFEMFEAIDDTVVCPQNKEHLQIFRKNAKVKDNCLIANVYVPETEEINLPVVVFIHGGAYQIGYGNFMTPKALVNQGKFIAVNFNYRLGIHGFLCLGTKDVPGNAGLKDMLAALKWVQKNIAAFGGNPNDVTLDGFSAGSSAAELLLLSKAAKGLFSKIITESGSATSVWSVQQNPIEIAKGYARRFHFITNDIYELEDFYTGASYDNLTSDDFFKNKDSTFNFVPCLEQPSSSAFMVDPPLNILKRGDFPKLPNLASYATKEGIFRLTEFYAWKDHMNLRFSDFLPRDLKFKSVEERELVAKQIKEFYFGDKLIGKDTVDGYIDYFSDILFKYSILQSTRLQAKAGSQVYLYDYSFFDNSSLVLKSKVQDLEVPGASHCAQTQALLEVTGSPIDESHVTEEYKRIMSILREVVINFVKSGRPVPEPSSSFPDGWPAVSADGSSHMKMDIPASLQGFLFDERAKFWDQIYDKYYSEPIPAPVPPIRHTEL